MAEENVAQKRCTKCGTEKERSYFYTSPSGKTESWCRSCQSLYRADYYEQHRTSIRLRQGPYNREYQKRRRSSDPEFRRKSLLSIRTYWNNLTKEEQVWRNKKKKLLRRYGITVEQWDALFSKQNGKCAICGEKPNKEKNFHVDHNHNTGAVRGLLCVGCNTSLGWLEKHKAKIAHIVDYMNNAAFTI